MQMIFSRGGLSLEGQLQVLHQRTGELVFRGEYTVLTGAARDSEDTVCSFMQVPYRSETIYLCVRGGYIQSASYTSLMGAEWGRFISEGCIKLSGLPYSCNTIT